MNVVDSSAWLAYIADEPNAQHFASAIEAPDSLIVPSITLLEVFKKSSAAARRRRSADLELANGFVSGLRLLRVIFRYQLDL